jgi:tetratricopeptide (TPR) repeat protein
VQASLLNQLRGFAQYTWDAWDDAATYLLESKLNLQQALQYSDRSIQNEERFENLLTKSRILDALGQNAEAATARKRAITQANTVQLHIYGRQLQNQGQQAQAFEIFRMNVKKNPNHWLTHSELARMACAQGNFDDAVKEMKLASDGAPDQQKPFIARLVKRLEAREDINK